VDGHGFERVYTRCTDKPATLSLAYSEVINTFKAKAARYFVTAARQRTFKHACDLLKTYGGLLILQANDHLNWSSRH
jgi:hypothetical protein